MAKPSVVKRTNTILYCDHWQETVEFYRGQLGFDVSYQNERLVEFRLTPSSFLSVANQSRTTMSSAGGKGITLSFQIDDLKTAHDAFAQNGMAPTDIRPRVMGADVFYLFDPEGTRIEFWCPSS